MSKQIIYERNCFITHTLTRTAEDFNFPENDEFFTYIDKDGKITKHGAEYLFDEYSPEGDVENLSFDQGYFKGYLCAMNDLLKHINTTN